MSTQIDRMKQLIESKKSNNNSTTETKRPTKSSGASTSKGFNSKKTGGAFDK